MHLKGLKLMSAVCVESHFSLLIKAIVAVLLKLGSNFFFFIGIKLTE